MPRKTTARKSSQLKRVGSSPVQAQKKINSDYQSLFKDYKKMSTVLWSKPATKYVVGGIAFASLIPVAIRLLGRFPKINTFIRENLDVVEEKLEDVGHMVTEKISALKNSSSSDDLTDTAH